MKKNQQAVSKKSLENGNILGVSISSTSKPKVLRFVRDRISRHKKFYLVTPNPEIVMAAQEDEKLLISLNSADILLPDGIGLAQAYNFLKLTKPKDTFKRLITLFVQGLGVGFLTIVDRQRLTKDFAILPGREMFIELIKLANKKDWRVYLLGGEGDEAKLAKRELEKTFKKVEIKTEAGPMLDLNAEPVSKKYKNEERETVQKINKFKPQLLFVGISSPRQEKWVYRWYKKLNIGGAMVVGGTFRYISGMVKLPPPWFEERGLEWAWRLFSGSQKIDRVLTAFPGFPLAVFWHKFTSKP